MAYLPIDFNIHKGKNKILNYNTVINQMILDVDALGEVELFIFLNSLVLKKKDLMEI